MDPDDTIETPPEKPRRVGRVRAAWQALRGAPLVPSQIRAEWVAWQFELEGLCDKLTTTASRLYQRDVRALQAAQKRAVELEAAAEQQSGSGDQAAAGDGWRMTEKRRLNRLVLASRGKEMPSFPLDGDDPHVDGD